MRVAIGENTIRHIYKSYKEKYPKSTVTFKEYREVCYLHNKKMMEAVIENGMRIRLPYRLGYLWVKKSPMTYKEGTLKFDYGEYNKTGIKSFHLNLHSDDFKARILWEKSKCIVKGKRPYCFQPTREWKRRLAAIMKSKGGHKKYFTKQG